MCGQARWGACNGHLGKSARSASAGADALIAVIGSREITAGIEPARRNGKVATLTVGLGHDVSTVLGRQRGSQPRANTSITSSANDGVTDWLEPSHGRPDMR